MVSASRETESQKGLETYSSSHSYYLGLRPIDCFFLLNNVIQICLTSKKLYIFNAYDAYTPSPTQFDSVNRADKRVSCLIRVKGTYLLQAGSLASVGV